TESIRGSLGRVSVKAGQSMCAILRARGRTASMPFYRSEPTATPKFRLSVSRIFYKGNGNPTDRGYVRLGRDLLSFLQTFSQLQVQLQVSSRFRTYRPCRRCRRGTIMRARGCGID